MKSNQLIATQISVSKQPINCVIKLTGNGQYKGKYYNGHEGNGWLKLADNSNDAHPMNAYTANEVMNMLARNAQHCYGGQFEITTK